MTFCAAQTAAQTAARLLLYTIFGCAAGVAVAIETNDGPFPDDITDAIPAYQTIRHQYRRSDVYVLDRNGIRLDRLRRDFTVRRGDWLELSEISPAMTRAVILSEDHRFNDHDGVDWIAVTGVAWRVFSGHRARGASTLSMQVASFLDPALARPGDRGVADKLIQIRRAQVLEQHWSKSQILEAYLNLVSFRGELVGIDAVSRVLFQKHAAGLNAREAALAAALLQGPNAVVPVLVQRSCRILTSMARADECAGLPNFITASLARRTARWSDEQTIAPHFSRLALAQAAVSQESSNVAIKTTLDFRLQDTVVRSVNRQLHGLSRERVRDAAVVVLDNASGDVLAYLGSSGDLSEARHVDHARALRQAGSALKPFLYAQALQEMRVTAASLLDNGPLDLSTASGLYIPQNYDKQFSGWVSVRVALASSLNIPAVRALTLVGPLAFARTLVQLGLPLDRSGDFYGYSLALGSADVTLLSLTNAYRTLANAGRHSSIRFLYSETHAPGRNAAHNNDVELPALTTVFAPSAAWIVGDILSDRQARSRTFGLDSPLSTPFWSAVKTGTSKDMRDNWAIGWTEHYTVGVWAGNTAGESMRDVSGVSGAGPVWHDIVQFLHRDRSSSQAPAPAGVSQMLIRFEDDLEPARQEAFIDDTGLHIVRPSRVATIAGQGPSRIVGAPRIVSPAANTVIALDPDIPLDYQRVALQATTLPDRGAGFRWMLKDNILGHGERVWWRPYPGRHAIRLVGPDGDVAGQVLVRVRG